MGDANNFYQNQIAPSALQVMERETGIEPASLAWKARVLPLNYSRIGQQALRARARKRTRRIVSTNAFDWWRGLDSNQCRRKPTDLQSAPFSHSGTPPENPGF